jgi:hypothetical protein
MTTIRNPMYHVYVEIDENNIEFTGKNRRWDIDDLIMNLVEEFAENRGYVNSQTIERILHEIDCESMGECVCPIQREITRS